MGLNIRSMHHVCIVCSNYEQAVEFYVHILGLTLRREQYSPAKKRHKLELYLNREYLVELFIQESAPDPKQPPHTGLEHLSFFVEDVERSINDLESRGVKTGPVALDRETGRQYAFFYDPDGTKLELYQAG